MGQSYVGVGMRGLWRRHLFLPYLLLVFGNFGLLMIRLIIETPLHLDIVLFEYAFAFSYLVQLIFMQCSLLHVSLCCTTSTGIQSKGS